LKSIDAKKRYTNLAEIVVDVIRFVITERLPGPDPHGKAGEDGNRPHDSERNATREGGERSLR
jgi:hypothetical protein